MRDKINENESMTVELIELRARLAMYERFRDFVFSAPVSTGVCCCGQRMDTHAVTMTWDHTPFDEWERRMSLWKQEMGIQNGPPQRAAPVPAGWKLVPIEPTREMCKTEHIGVDVYTGITHDNEYYSIGGCDAAKIYKAMLAAAPSLAENPVS